MRHSVARNRARGGLFLFLLSVAAPRAWAQANIPLDSFLVTDGTVYGITESAGTVYLGGAFDYVGPRTGNLVRLDAATGAPDLAFPKVEGRVYCLASDGTGGWFVGGAFVSVGGLLRRSLAHVLANGSVSSWNPNPPVNSTILTLAVSGRSVYVGGSFAGVVGGQSRNNIAALDAASGLATSWNPNANSVVDEIIVAGNLVYAGGSFGMIGGLSKSRLAALDAGTGAATTWSPNVNNSIGGMALSGTTMYIGGSFTMIGGQTRNNIGAVSTLTGAPTAWNPNANSLVLTLKLEGTTLYAGGIFSSIGGAVRNNIAALDTTVDTNNATAWNPNANSTVYALAVAGTTFYAGGDFTTIGGQPRMRLAALDTTVSVNNATAWNPGANSTVDVIVPDGPSVYVGGALSSTGGQTRGRIAALDAATGALTAFNPGGDGDVRTIAVSGSRVFAGGLFLNIGGQARARVAALNTGSGTAVAGWNPGTDNNVLAVDVSGGTVYAGGIFGTAGGFGRLNLAAFDEVTGAVSSWNPTPTSTSQVNALKVSGTTVYAGGTFDYAGRNRIVALDTTTALPTAWNPNADNVVYELAVTATLVYAAGDFTNIGGASRNRLASLDRALDTNNATAWNPNASGSVTSVVTGSGSIFAGGFFTIMGGSGTRNRLAGFNEATGALSAWDPNADNTVEAIALGTGRLYAGGSFFKIGAKQFRGFAAFCLAAAPTGLTANPIGAGQIDLSWTGTAPSYNVYRSLTAGGPHVFLASTAVPEYSDTTVQGVAAYYYVVRAVDSCESDPSNEATATTTGACSLPPDFEGLGWVQQATGGTCAVDLGWAPATAPCTGSVSYTVHRDTSASFVPSAANLVATVSAGTTYTDATPLVPATTYYYIVRATSQLNQQQEVNLVRRAVTPTSCSTGAPGTVAGFSVTSRGNENVLQWVNPPGFGTVRIRYDSGPTCAFPTDPLSSGTLLADDVGLPGEARRYPDTSLSDDTSYCYTLFVDTGGGGSYSAGRSNRGRPFATSGPVKWAFSAGVFSTTPPTVGGAGVISTSNGAVVHASERGPSGGEWPSGWQPYPVGGPIQSRSPVIPITVGSANPVVYLSSQDGKVHAIDGAKGGAVVPAWVATLPGALQGAPAGIFSTFFGAFNYVIVGTRITAGDNAFVALDPDTGATIGTPFDNGGAPNGIGIINGSAAVDYATSRVYFASFAGGNPNTLWCLQLGASPVFAPAWARADLGDIEGSPVLRNDRVYVGSPNGGGTLYSIDASGNSLLDVTFVHGDGQVKGFVFPDRTSPTGNLYFATDTKVWVVEDDGSTLTPKYAGGVSLGGGVTPSVVLYAPGRGLVFAGGSDGKVYQIDVSGAAPVVKSVQLGDGSALVGAPSLDREFDIVHVGTAAGVFYAVQIPIP